MLVSGAPRVFFLCDGRRQSQLAQAVCSHRTSVCAVKTPVRTSHNTLLHSKEVHHAMEMARVLGMRATNVPWSDKTQAAVYRGSCYPTANPDGDSPGYLLLRGALCMEAASLNSPFIDVGALMPLPIDDSTHEMGFHTTGTGIDPNYVQDAGSAYCSGAFYKPLCDECAPCNASRPMGRAEMGNYKYQISAEGYGPTADAIYVRVYLGTP